MRARLSTSLCGWSLLLLLSVSSCKNHSATSPQPEKSAQAVAQASIQARIESVQEKSCREFVQSFYDGYFDRLNREMKKPTEGSVEDEVLFRKPAILSARLARLLKEDAEAAAKSPGEIVELDFDPFINAQDWEDKYSVQGVSLNGSDCRASLWGTDSGAKREIVDPELNFTNGQWIFVNFHYPGNSNPHDKNLIDILIALRNDRNRSEK